MGEQAHERQDLGDGLVMRPATPADREALAEFNAMVHGGSSETPDDQAAAWVRDLFRGDHPTSPISDHSIVEDATIGQIVSSCLLISQTWIFDGVPIAVGRPELVGTHLDYRGKGLIGKQFAQLHRISTERGQLVQALTGIPFFYRRFGYEPALIVSPPVSGPAANFVHLPAIDQERFHFRPAMTDDAPLISTYYDRSTRRSTIAAVRDEAFWRYELSRDPGSDYIHDFVVIESNDRTPLGVLAHVNRLQRGKLVTSLAEVSSHIDWSVVAEPIMRFLRTRAEALGEQSGESAPWLGFDLVPDHPLLRLTASRLPQTSKAFAWDVRIPDVIAFLTVITPVLERRLSNSFLAGFSGALEMTLYQPGIRIEIQNGRIASIEPWLPPSIWRADIAIPERAFLYLLFGSRSLDEIDASYPDCRVRTDLARVLLEILFPRTPSVIWPIG